MARNSRLICAGADLVEGGSGVRFEHDAPAGRVPAFVVRFDGVARAYVNRCAQVAMELDWQPGAFFDADGLYLICATHGAMYDAATGLCVGGPCRGKRLAVLSVREVDGAIYLEE